MSRQLHLAEISWKVLDISVEIAMLAARMEFIAFGGIESDEFKESVGFARDAERDFPLTEWDIFLALNHAYTHLNRSWNGRFLDKEPVDSAGRLSIHRLKQFPRCMVFRDLWPPKSCLAGGALRIPGKQSRQFSALTMHPFLQLAARKLALLSRRIECVSFENKSDENACEKPVAPFTEKELGWRLHRIYEQFNLAWANRHGMENRRSGEQLSVRAMRRRGQFPVIFIKWTREYP